jgi:ADP-ribose pyrophosphatase YjhB (NUDIX family)
MQVWANPIPVSVVIVPVVDGDRTGVLVVRRAIPPGIGKLALVGGFVEEHESWQAGGAREVREETGIVIDGAKLEPLWFASSDPKPNRVLLFGVAPDVLVTALPPFVHDHEASERGLIFGPGGLEADFAFPTHVEAARRYFGARGRGGPHGFVAR